MGRGRVGAVLAALALVVGACGPARASGVAGQLPWYLDAYGGEPADLQALYGGRLGVVMARSPRPQLYIAWRLLHGQSVGPVAGASLSIPCCSPPDQLLYDTKGVTGAGAWLAARTLVKGAPRKDYTPTGSEQPYFMWSQACFDDAFATAARTLKARVAKYGADTVWVRAWLDRQDAVFANCRGLTAMPVLAPGAPPWLLADRAYQDAAAALYAGRADVAAAAFGDIARDPASPWRPMATYLRARALRRAALAEPTPARFAVARLAIAELAMKPADTFGRGEVVPMLRSLAYRDRPRELMAELSEELSRPRPPPMIASTFRDAVTLTGRGGPGPDVIDWIATLRPRVSDEALSKVDWKPEAVALLERAARQTALTHAQARWAATHDTAWLIAALGLVSPGAPEVPALAAAGGRVAANDPGWLTVQYHLGRLSLPTAPAADSRRRLDAILALKTLSPTDRNLFTAHRLQVAADARDFVRFALRRRVCSSPLYDDYTTRSDGCLRSLWLPAYVQPSSVYDGTGDAGTTGFGEDARAIIDRMRLSDRIALSRDPGLPKALRLDVAITSYARAVALRDRAAVDGLAGDLAVLLPQMAGDWRRIKAAPAGPSRRFAELFVLAKVPGIRTDLADYTRPEGTVGQFQYYWIDWLFVPKGRPVMPEPPPLGLYQRNGSGGAEDLADASTDLTCLGECAAAPAPLRLPDFVVAGQTEAIGERGYFIRATPEGWGDKPPAPPPAAISAWDEVLTYARSNRADPQVPEALYWLVRVGRWGGSHDRSGKRAFDLLHARYPQSTWAKRSPYFYD